MIASYRNKETEKMAMGERVKKFQAIERIARRTLLGLRAASRLEDLAAHPGNRLDALKGDRKGQYSLPVNDQYRICFAWKDGSAYEVEIVECHS